MHYAYRQNQKVKKEQFSKEAEAAEQEAAYLDYLQLQLQLMNASDDDTARVNALMQALPGGGAAAGGSRAGVQAVQARLGLDTAALDHLLQ